MLTNTIEELHKKYGTNSHTMRKLVAKLQKVNSRTQWDTFIVEQNIITINNTNVMQTQFYDYSVQGKVKLLAYLAHSTLESR